MPEVLREQVCITAVNNIKNRLICAERNKVFSNSIKRRTRRPIVRKQKQVLDFENDP